ncbi:MAG: DHA2 family efflux MFS transporter permease subunit [Candidatus Tectomicrobia bacterium]
MASGAKRVQPYTMLGLDTQASSYKWLVAAILLLSGGTQTFAGNSVNLAIPRLMAAFGADLATTQWVTTGFLIARTLVIPILGWLGAVMGNRNLFVAIMTGFVVSSIGCGMSTSLPMLVAFRLLQGVVLGPMEGLSAVMMVQAFPPQQRGLALGLRSIGWSAGHIISFTLGGYFLEQLSWRLIFFMGVPTGILSIVLGLLVLPQQRDHQGEPVDYLGLMLLGGFLVPLLLAISLARDSNTTVLTVVLLGFGAAAGGVLFILWELWSRFPAVNLRLFRIPAFRYVCATAFLNTLGLFGAQFMVPIFLQQVMGFTPLQAGLIIVPALIVSGFSGVVSGRLNDVMSPAFMTIAGFIALTGVFLGFASVTALTTAGVLVGYIILYRICMFSSTTSLTALNMQSLPPEEVRMGQGLLGVVRNIGATLGVTVTSVLFERRRVTHQLMAYHDYNETSTTHGATLDEVKRYLHQAGIMGGTAEWAALRTIKRHIDVEAIAAAFRDSFMMISVAFLFATVPLLWMVIRRHTNAPQSQVQPL